MGVDFWACRNCGETFPDCGYYTGCSCGEVWCCESCAKADGFAEEIDEETDEVIDDSGTCNFCREEDFKDCELLNHALDLLKMERNDLIYSFKQCK